MNRFYKVSVVALCSLVAGAVFAQEKTNQELYKDGFEAIKQILTERDEFRKKVASLEKVKAELEALLAIKVGNDEGLVKKLAALKTELEDLFMMDGGAKEDSINAAIEKLTLLKKELKELFPAQSNEPGSSVLDMIQKLSTLKSELEILLPKAAQDQAPAPVQVGDMVKQVSDFRSKLGEILSAEEGGQKDLLTRIKDRIAKDKECITKYEERIAKDEQLLNSKDLDAENMKKEVAALKKEAAALKKEVKEIAGYLREIVVYAQKNR